VCAVGYWISALRDERGPVEADSPVGAGLKEVSKASPELCSHFTCSAGAAAIASAVGVLIIGRQALGDGGSACVSRHAKKPNVSRLKLRSKRCAVSTSTRPRFRRSQKSPSAGFRVSFSYSHFLKQSESGAADRAGHRNLGRDQL
jgi:hypothetical protein